MSSLVDEVIEVGKTVPGISEVRLHLSGDYLEILVTGCAEPYQLPCGQLAHLVQTATPQQRAEIIRRRLAAAVETFTDQAAGQSWRTVRLLLVRTMLMPPSVQARLPGAVVGAEVLPGVAETAVLDRPTSIANITPRELDRWQVPVAEVLAAGRDNLAAAPAPARWKQLPG